MSAARNHPVCVSNCADCGAGTITLGEWYMVKSDVTGSGLGPAAASPGTAQFPDKEILCIGCLEQRLGRTLMSCDFDDVPINDPTKPNISDRLRDRLTTDRGTVNGLEGLLMWMAGGMIQKLPEHQQEEAWAAFRNSVLKSDEARH